MISWDEAKQYFWYVFGLMGVVFFWTGIWDGVGNLSYLRKPLVSLVMGIVMLTLSPFLFRDADPFWGRRREVEKQLRRVHQHKERHHFVIAYHDQRQRQKVRLSVAQLQRIEKGVLVFLDAGRRELFVPMHRVKEIFYKNRLHWRAG